MKNDAKQNRYVYVFGKTYRQTDRQAGRQEDRQADRQKDRQTNWWKHRTKLICGLYANAFKHN